MKKRKAKVQEFEEEFDEYLLPEEEELMFEEEELIEEEELGELEEEEWV